VRVLDLFSGIGGFSLGLERAGFKTIAFCEINEWARKVIAKNWPNVPVMEDVTTIGVPPKRRSRHSYECSGLGLRWRRNSERT
jgi:site-specific DNA-cytosine methylase